MKSSMTRQPAKVRVWSVLDSKYPADLAAIRYGLLFLLRGVNPAVLAPEGFISRTVAALFEGACKSLRWVALLHSGKSEPKVSL